MDADLRDATPLDEGTTLGAFHVTALQGRTNLWLAVRSDGRDVMAVRIGRDRGELTALQRTVNSDGSIGFAFVTPLGPMRATVDYRNEDRAAIHWTVSLTANEDAVIDSWARDLCFPSVGEARIHTAQRGLRTGTLFASVEGPTPFSFFYLQDFSSLNEYFDAARRGPADTVGGRWPELGYAPPSGTDCVLPKAREIIVSDAYLLLEPTVPATKDAAAPLYLDLLADIYLRLSRPDVAYHDWPTRAARALRDLSNSPLCSDARHGRRYLKPYVGDDTKPPESMVQLTLTANVDEYDAWRGERSVLGTVLRSGVPSFFDEDLTTLVRWLPGEPFAASQADGNMSHAAMDSWYLHHALFNASRLAESGDATAKALFARSLPYAIRVAHRFDYRWPIFFDLGSLDIIRAEAAPGTGGETDVAGLYALVMLRAYELLGEKRYLEEAQAAAARLEGLGFDLAYQLNTTGFAAEAMLRLWKITRVPSYLRLSEVCMANLFDNMWIWRCGYGNARHYRTYFGLFPLRDAPYLAPYEELEAHAKFHVYLALGGEDLRPSLRLLIAEFQKYSLDRGWYFYPDALPVDVIGQEVRNGRIERELSVPLEDLRDGFDACGQVGQEVYGAGLPFVYTTRHYMRVASGELLAYCDYPAYDFREDGRTVSWTTGGDPRGTCTLRVMPAGANLAATGIRVEAQAGSVRVPLHGTLSAEGHALFALRGAQTIHITWSREPATTGATVVVGAMCAEPRNESLTDLRRP
ncbi:MAG TPA: hypothetical protein VMD91_08270 [Candidatus Sulfotelmatobacter sp.]|nr:hypothetical protein [Candidatus Sulfotelmatobacter sp.]